MSLEVTIKPNGLCQKEISYEELLKLGIELNFNIGVMNEIGVNYDYEGDNTIKEVLLNIYSKDSYGTGFSFYIDEENKISMKIPYSATKTDIELFYSLIEKLCNSFNVSTFMRENEIKSIYEISSMKKDDMEIAKKLITDSLKKSKKIDGIATVPGCICPIAIEPNEFKQLSKFNVDALYEKYEQYLNKKQKQVFYYSNPMCFEVLNKQTNKTEEIAVFTLIVDFPSVLPVHKELPIAYWNRKKKPNISKWLIALTKLDDDTIKGILTFDDFQKTLRGYYVEKFDANNYIYELDEEIVNKLLNVAEPFKSF